MPCKTEVILPLDVIPQPAAFLRQGVIIASNAQFDKLFKDAPAFTGPGSSVESFLEKGDSRVIDSIAGDALAETSEFSMRVRGSTTLYTFCFTPVRSALCTGTLCTVKTGIREKILSLLPLVTILTGTSSPLRIEYISPLILDWTGYPPDAFIEDPLLLLHLVHPEDKQRFMAAMEDLGDSSVFNELTYRITNKNGGFLWIRQTREKGVEGDSGTLFVLRDITREKEMELDLAEAKERYQLFFDKAPLGIACIDRHGFIVDCNSRLCRLFQLSRERLVGMNVLDPSMPLVREYSRRILRGEEIHYEGPYTSVISDVTVEVEVDGFPLRDETGMVIGGFTIFQDISTRLKLERTLRRERDFNRAVIDAAATIVLILDREGRIQQANRTTELITGFSLDDLKGRKADEYLIHLKTRKKFQQAFELAVNSITESPVETLCSSSSGEDRLVEWSFTTIMDRDLPLRIIATGVDRTEQRRLEDQFREAQKMDAIGRLAGGVAHEFNNQLTAIQGYCQMLLLNASPESPEYEPLKNIEKAVKRSADTANRLLAYSRRQTLQLKQVDIVQAVKESAELFGKIFEENIEIEIDLPDEPCIASIDPNRLQQILLNLALNARDAMPDGGKLNVSVALEPCHAEVRSDDANGQCVSIKVQDTGYGMPPEVVEKVFEPFFTTKPVGKGTGLGLAMVYGTVKQSKGHVIIESAEDVGTCVTIYLPASGPDEHTQPDTATRLVKGSAYVILVEDEESVNETVTAFLEKLGYRARSFFSAEDALEFLSSKEVKECRPDILLTDVILSGMTGKQLADRIRETIPEIKVVFMSGYASDKLADKGIVQEDITLLNKPFSIFELGETLGGIVES